MFPESRCSSATSLSKNGLFLALWSFRFRMELIGWAHSTKVLKGPNHAYIFRRVSMSVWLISHLFRDLFLHVCYENMPIIFMNRVLTQFHFSGRFAFSDISRHKKRCGRNSLSHSSDTRSRFQLMFLMESTPSSIHESLDKSVSADYTRSQNNEFQRTIFLLRQPSGNKNTICDEEVLSLPPMSRSALEKINRSGISSN